MVHEFLHDTFWGSQAAAAGTGLLFAMAACIWAMNLGKASASALPPAISPRGDRRGGADHRDESAHHQRPAPGHQQPAGGHPLRLLFGGTS
jgi:hypothetical protein